MAVSYMEIKFDGAPIDATLEKHLVSVSVKEAMDKLDSVEFKFTVPEDKALLKKLALYAKSFEVILYKEGSANHSVYGDVVDISFSRSAAAPWTVTVVGMDYLHRLKSARPASKVKDYDRIFRDKQDSQIVETVAKDWDLKTDVQGTQGAPRFIDWKQDDAALLKLLAKENNYIVRVNAKNGTPTLVFSRVDAASQAQVKLQWGTEVTDVNVTHSLDGLYTKVKVTGSKAHAGAKPVKGEADKNKLKKISGPVDATGVAFAEKMGAVELVIENNDGSYPDQSAAQQKAIAELQAKAESFLSGSLTSVFRPDACSGGKLTIEKAGWPLDGDFIIQEVTHSMDAGGYKTQLTFLSDGLASKSP